MVKYTPVLSYKRVYKGIAELGFLVKHLSQSKQNCDVPFHVLCLAFTPLIRKSISRLSKRKASTKDLEQEVVSTLFEAIVAFEWDRCRDENFFSFFSAFIKQRLQFIPSWRMRKETRELPRTMRLPDRVISPMRSEQDSGYPSMDELLVTIENALSPKHADLVFCTFVLRMTQTDIGKVFGCTQKGVNWWWKKTKQQLRTILKKPWTRS